MKHAEFELIVTKAMVEESKALEERAKSIFDENGMADIKTVCAFLLEIPTVSTNVCKSVIENSGVIQFDPEEA